MHQSSSSVNQSVPTNTCHQSVSANSVRVADTAGQSALAVGNMHSAKNIYSCEERVGSYDLTIESTVCLCVLYIVDGCGRVYP